jgi:hypothetical protein
MFFRAVRYSCLLTIALSTSVAAQQWTAQRTLLIGEDQGIAFGRIGGVAAAPDGRIFVLDAAESRVQVFSPTGKLERTFGRRGAGPGELSALPMGLFLLGNQLAVIDALNQRVSLFDTQGTFVHSRPLSLTQGVPAGWAAAGNRLVYLARPINLPAQVAAQMGGIKQHTVLSFDPRNDAAPDTLFRMTLPPDNEMSIGSSMDMKMKFDLRVPQMVLSGDGLSRLMIATTDTYRIRVLAVDGKTTGWLTRNNVSRHRYTRAELERRKQVMDSTTDVAFKRSMAAVGGRGMPRPQMEYIMPEFAPMLVRIVASDRYVLVQRSDDKAKAIEWDILDYTSKLLGTVTLPPRFEPMVLLNDKLIGVEEDDLEIQSVATYQIKPKQ